jgi:hypothetical protein
MGQALTESIREEHRLRQKTRTRVAFLHSTAMISLFLMSCGGDDRTIESTVRYEPPIEHRIVVETVVDLPFDEAWNNLIRRLSESSFRVSTLEKASRFVAVELLRSSDLAATANRPARYVDCGRTVRSFSDGEGTERFDYAVAKSSHHREATAVESGYRVSDVDRRVELEARSTLYLQPEGGGRTRITLKATYELKIQIAGSAQIISSDSGEPAGPKESFGPRVESIRFTTFQPGQDQRRGGLTCRATGELEHALIALANPAAAI